MRLPQPPAKWSPAYQSGLNDAISLELRQRRGAGDIELQRQTTSGATRDERLILRSPDGTRWAITVDNGGTVSATAV